MSFADAVSRVKERLSSRNTKVHIKALKCLLIILETVCQMAELFLWGEPFDLETFPRCGNIRKGTLLNLLSASIQFDSAANINQRTLLILPPH